MKEKQPAKPSDQSARFIEAAKKLGVDESGKTFERVFKKIAKHEARAEKAASKTS